MIFAKTKGWSPRGQILLVILLFGLSASVASAMREVRVGFYDSPPLISASNGAPVGVFADILAEVSKKEGLKLTYVYGTWEENLSWVKSGKLDLILVVGMSRGETGELSMNKLPVFFTWTQLFKPKGARWGSVLDLDGKRVGGCREDLNMSLFKRVASDIGIHPEYVETESITEAFQLLSERRVAAVVAERATGRYYAKQFPIELTPLLLSPRCFAFATARGANLDLLEMIDRYLLKEKQTPNSTYWKILAHWGETEPFQIPPYVPWIFGPAISLLILSACGNVLFKRKVRIKTQELADRNQLLEEEVAKRKWAEEALKKLNTELEQRVIERTAQLEAANKELEAFSYSVSHDLRAPLRAIHGFCNILHEDFAPRLEPEMVRLLNVIGSEACRMGQLIDGLLNFSHLSRQSLKQEIVSSIKLVNLAREQLLNAQVGRQIEITVGDLPPTTGDPALLLQVWVNLLSNAIKYTAPRAVTKIWIGGRQEAGEVVYFIKDNGVGFDMKYADKLFEVFQRLHSPAEFDGTGIGLSLVQRIVHRHGGRVWAEGKINEGATFYFALPKPKDK